MIVVDSSVWIANLRNADRPAVRALRSARRSDIVVGDVVLLEVLRGARDEAHAKQIERELRRFRVEPMLDPNVAVIAARHYRTLRRYGIALSKVPDLLIATFCVENDYVLLHDDRDFAPLVALIGLRVVPA